MLDASIVRIVRGWIVVIWLLKGYFCCSQSFVQAPLANKRHSRLFRPCFRFFPCKIKCKVLFCWIHLHNYDSEWAVTLTHGVASPACLLYCMFKICSSSIFVKKTNFPPRPNTSSNYYRDLLGLASFIQINLSSLLYRRFLD